MPLEEEFAKLGVCRKEFAKEFAERFFKIFP
jgi:hypothetical protein